MASFLVMTTMLISFLHIVLIYSFFNIEGILSLTLTYITTILIALSVILLFSELSDALKITWFVLLIVFLISYIVNHGGIDYICNTIIILGLFTALPNVKLDKRFIWAFLFFYLLYAVLVFIFANKSVDDTGIITLNPNGSCFIFLCAEIILVALSFRFDVKGKAICLIGVLLFVVGQFLFGGRSSLIGTCLILLYFFFHNKINNITPKFAKWTTFGLILGGILFALLYLALYKILGDDVYFLGKDIFSGREVIWMDAFNQVNAECGWFFGIGLRLKSIAVNGFDGFTNLHNQSMGYYVTFGATTLIAYAVLFSLISQRLTFGKNKMFTYTLFLFIILSYFDTILYSTANIVHLILVFVLVYYFSKEKENKMVIHYCWLGKNPKSEKINYCIDSWKKICPNVQIIEWNESNYDVNKNEYIKQAYEQGKYAFVADYMRFDIIYNQGGVYMDTDVELLKDIAPLTDKPFMGFEGEDRVNPGLIMNALGGEKLLKEIIEYYDAQESFSMDKTVVHITTEILKKHGLKKEDIQQEVAGFIIYPSEYFNPKGGDYGKEERTKNTYSVHHYLASWKSPLEQKLMQYRVKFGYKKGNLFFTICHPILALKKHRSKK